jgi:calcium permeable stress-gated cation channel
MAIMFTLAGSLFGLFVVIPVQNQLDPDSDWGNFTRFDLRRTEVEKKHEKESNAAYLWAYLVFTYAFTALLSYFLLKQSSVVSKRRQEYLGSQSSVADRTIKISGIPHDLRTEDKLREFVQKLRIGDVSAVTICRDWRNLDELAAKREATLGKLEEAYVTFEGRHLERDMRTLPVAQPDAEGHQRSLSSATTESQPLLNGHQRPKVRRRRPRMRLGPWGILGKEVDSIDYYTAKLQHMDQTLLEARKLGYPATSMAFVTFETVSGAVIIFRSLSDNSNLPHNLF